VAALHCCDGVDTEGRVEESRANLLSNKGIRFRGCWSTTTSAAPFDDCLSHVGYWEGMDVERIIDEIEQLKEMFEAPDIRPLSASDISAANRRHDETLAHSPWFRLWQRYGVCCRVESPVVQLGEVD
jgi:hypothetical protein